MLGALALAAFSFGVALVTLFSGFGLGTMLLPAFALFLPIEVAVASTAVVHMANNLFKAGILAGRVDRTVLVRFGVPAVVASFAGATLLTALSRQAPLATWTFVGRPAHVTPLGLLMGGLIVGFALLELTPVLHALHARPAWLPLGGALSGFFGGLSGHQGALRAAFLGPLGLSPPAFASTQAVLALVVDAARLAVYGWSFTHLAVASGGIPWHLVGVATAAAFAGSLLGKRLLPRVTMAGLHVTVGVLLVVIGMALAAGVA